MSSSGPFLQSIPRELGDNRPKLVPAQTEQLEDLAGHDEDRRLGPRRKLLLGRNQARVRRVEYHRALNSASLGKIENGAFSRSTP